MNTTPRNKKFQIVRSFLWKKRGNLKCYICNGSVIFYKGRDKFGYTWSWECLKCNSPQNEYSLAQHNGLDLKSLFEDSIDKRIK